MRAPTLVERYVLAVAAASAVPLALAGRAAVPGRWPALALPVLVIVLFADRCTFVETRGGREVAALVADDGAFVLWAVVLPTAVGLLVWFAGTALVNAVDYRRAPLKGAFNTAQRVLLAAAVAGVLALAHPADRLRPVLAAAVVLAASRWLGRPLVAGALVAAEGGPLTLAGVRDRQAGMHPAEAVSATGGAVLAFAVGRSVPLLWAAAVGTVLLSAALASRERYRRRTLDLEQVLSVVGELRTAPDADSALHRLNAGLAGVLPAGRLRLQNAPPGPGQVAHPVSAGDTVRWLTASPDGTPRRYSAPHPEALLRFLVPAAAALESILLREALGRQAGTTR